MTETTPGQGFTNIDLLSSTISDMLKDLGIKMKSNKDIYELIHSLGETGYLLYHEEDLSRTGYNKFHLINTKRKSVDSILLSK